jgi:hypothetical protein
MLSAGTCKILPRNVRTLHVYTPSIDNAACGILSRSHLVKRPLLRLTWMRLSGSRCAIHTKSCRHYCIFRVALALAIVCLFAQTSPDRRWLASLCLPVGLSLLHPLPRAWITNHTCTAQPHKPKSSLSSSPHSAPTLQTERLPASQGDGRTGGTTSHPVQCSGRAQAREGDPAPTSKRPH